MTHLLGIYLPALQMRLILFTQPRRHSSARASQASISSHPASSPLSYLTLCLSTASIFLDDAVLLTCLLAPLKVNGNAGFAARLVGG